MPPTLYLVRHGESVSNAQGRIQGQTCAGLTEHGHDQARAVAAALAARLDGTVRLVTSDLRRTRETAAPLTEVLGVEATVEPGLRERSCGRWEGALPADLIRDEPELWARWRAKEDVLGEVGGESVPVLTARVQPVLAELLATTPSDGATIAVTHGGPTWYGTHALLGLAVGVLSRPGNAAICEVVQQDDGPQLRTWNERGHLHRWTTAAEGGVVLP